MDENELTVRMAKLNSQMIRAVMHNDEQGLQQAWEEVEALRMQWRLEHHEPSITCPKCGMTSYNPNDIREGYCGHCHDWTGDRRG